MREARQLRGSERGQVSIEWVGVLAVIAAVVVAILAADLDRTVAGAVDRAICSITGDGGCGGEDGGGGAGGPEGAPVQQAGIVPGGRDGGGAPATFQLANGITVVEGESDEDVPGAPEPPPPPAEGDGSGEHGESGVGIRDRATKFLAQRLADAADVRGYTNAARHLRHYLDNSGDTLDVDPGALLRDIPAFREQTDRSLQQMLERLQDEARRQYTGQPLTLLEDGADHWRSMPSDPAVLGEDWFYAMGGFSYTYSARARVEPPADGTGEPTIVVDYRLHIFDRYNWDAGKSVTIGPVTVEDRELQKLHQVGIAQEYVIEGSTDAENVEIGLDEDVGDVEGPPEAGDREGGRSDPGRDTGRGGRGRDRTGGR